MSDRIVVVRERSIAAISASGVQGAPGPQGPPGPPGGGAYLHIQDTPASVWVIDHNLGHAVHTTLIDDNGIVMHADVTHGTVNQTTVSFANPKTGSVVFS